MPELVPFRQEENICSPTFDVFETTIESGECVDSYEVGRVQPNILENVVTA